jgi:hypothetical protein
MVSRISSTIGAWQLEQNASLLVASIPVLKAPQKKIPPKKPSPSKTPELALLGVESLRQNVLTSFIYPLLPRL